MIEIISDEIDPGAFCYTSGTSGRTKGVLTTHRGSYLADLANAFESYLSRSSVYLCLLPAFHAADWTYPWAVTAALGTHYILHYILRGVDPGLMWDALLDHGVTRYCGAPTVQIILVNPGKARRLPRMVRVAIAASAATADLLGKLERQNSQSVHFWGLSESYGRWTKGYFDPSWSHLNVERGQD